MSVMLDLIRRHKSGVPVGIYSVCSAHPLVLEAALRLAHRTEGVALIDGSDATLKRFYREGNVIRLQPSNSEMAPIYAPAASVNIQGKVLGVLRKYA